jgi:hypothetical protein
MSQKEMVWGGRNRGAPQFLPKFRQGLPAVSWFWKSVPRFSGRACVQTKMQTDLFLQAKASLLRGVAVTAALV